MVTSIDAASPPLDEVTSIPKNEATHTEEGSNSSHDKGTSSPGEGSASPAEKAEKPPLRKRERMPTLPDFLKPKTKFSSFWERLAALIAQEANFYVCVYVS